MRSSWLLFILVLFATPAQAVDGFDAPGGDYTNFEAASWFVCRNSCGGDSRCQAWTWVRPGVQGPSGRCWLKSRVPALVKNPCCNSGSGANIRKADLKAEDKTDRPGFDINNFTVRGWKACEAACAGEGNAPPGAMSAPACRGRRPAAGSSLARRTRSSTRTSSPA